MSRRAETKIILPLTAVALLIAATALIVVQGLRDRTLAQAEIDALRGQYPIYNGTPSDARMRPMTEDLALQLLDESETILYAESTGVISRYSKKMDLFSDDPDMRAKLDAESPSWDMADY